MPKPQRKPGPLTRAEMEAVIDRGHAILHEGLVITRKEHLPSELELAGDDTERKQRAKDDLQAQVAKLQAALAAAEEAEDAGPPPPVADPNDLPPNVLQPTVEAPGEIGTRSEPPAEKPAEIGTSAAGVAEPETKPAEKPEPEPVRPTVESRPGRGNRR